MFLQLGSKPTVVVSSSKVASQVMKTLDHAFSGRPPIGVMKHVVYGLKDVIFSPYDEHWRQMRSICVLHLLTNKRVRSFRQARQDELTLMIKRIRDSGSSAVNMSDLFLSFSNDLICGIAFGRKYREEEGCGGVEKSTKEGSSLLGSGNVEDVLPWLGWINRFNGFNVKVKKVAKAYDDLLERILLEHEAGDRVKEWGTIDDGENVKDFVDILLQVQREGNFLFDRESIKAVIHDMFAAGTHTGYITMEYAFTEILRHPQVLHRLEQEIRGIVGDNEYVTEEDLDKMTYLKTVIKENFRLHPPLPILVPRECTEDVKLNGYDISKGTQVIVSAWTIGRDPKIWEDPESFVPERFLDSNVDYRGQDFELIPFGAGRRGCPGISFAMSAIELVLANLVHHFEWAVPAGMKESLDVNEAPAFTPHKETPLVVVATPRIIN